MFCGKKAFERCSTKNISYPFVSDIFLPHLVFQLIPFDIPGATYEFDDFYLYIFAEVDVASLLLFVYP